MRASQKTLTPTSSADQNISDLRSHAVQFYTSDSFLLDELSRFIGSALGAGDAAIVVATREHRDALARRLMARGLDLPFAITQGRYVALDARETLSELMPGGHLDPARFTELIGNVITRAAEATGSERPRVAVFGEMVALLWADGRSDAMIQLERLWNGLARTHSFQLLCAYPITLFERAFDAHILNEICKTHTHVLPDESYTALASEEERLRAVTLLQQKALALQTEIDARRQAQYTLERREQQLLDKNSELRHAVAAHDDFLSVAAYELKTPMTILLSFAQQLLRDIEGRRDIPPERLEAAVDAIERQTDKLNHLVSRLLDSTKIQAGKLRIEPARIDLVALVRSVLSHQASKDHSFLFHAPERLEANLDPIRVEQVITNLLDNAVKFSPHGGTVTVTLEQASDRHITLSITDEGLGIPPHEREALFDRFQQSQGNRHLSGMGLGLYISREIIELHAGTIRFEEPERPGARFVATFPPSLCA